MVGAGFSHYWSVQSLSTMVPIAKVAAPAKPTLPNLAIIPTPKISAPNTNTAVTPTALAKGDSQEAFYNELLAELKQLKTENRDLRDLMGETNRDVMKLAFKVDTHSESFRPLPTTEQRQDTSFHFAEDPLPGVLPPRAMPIKEFGE